MNDGSSRPTPPSLATSLQPRVISRFEANLVRITRFLMRQVPADQAMPLLTGRLNRPKCLSADAVYLVQDSLAKGIVLYLARVGGWRDERGIAPDGRVVVGRVWDRLPLAQRQLHFSAQALEFLLWLTACNPNDNDAWQADPDTLTPADQWLVFSAFELLRGEEFARSLRLRNEIIHNPLCRLVFPEDFTTIGPLAPNQMAAFLTPPGVVIFEAMQPYLQARWVEIERRKSQVVDWSLMRNRSIEQQAILTQFLQQCVAVNRRDLAQFLLRALCEILRPNIGIDSWLAGLLGDGANTPTRLAERIEIQRLAFAVVRQMQTLAEWTRQARSVAYYDDDYSLAQLWLSIWQHNNGDLALERAQSLLRQIEPMRLGANQASG